MDSIAADFLFRSLKFFYSLSILSFALLIFPTCLAAQQAQQGMWLGGQLQVKLSQKWAWHNDAGFRTVNTNFTPYQMLYRTGARYFAGSNFSIAGGGAVFFTRSSFDKSNHEFGREFRLWEEVIYQTNLDKVAWQNRFIAEQRFFDDTQRKPGYTAHRFRLKTTFTKPMKGKWALQLGEEYMLQLAHGGFAFDQNRVMFYGLYNINTNTAWRGGYMWLLLPGDHSRHAVNINFQKTIDLKRNKVKQSGS